MIDKTYTKMCECEEIQSQWKKQLGDRYVAPNGTAKTSSWHEGLPPSDPPIQCIWLPRQEDIQEMLPSGTCWFEKHFRFYEWAGRTSATTLSAWNRFDTAEQCWLAFYMSTHNKIWNPVKEEWQDA